MDHEKMASDSNCNFYSNRLLICGGNGWIFSGFPAATATDSRSCGKTGD